MNRGHRAVILLIAVLLVAGCSGGSSSPLAPNLNSPADISITSHQIAVDTGQTSKASWGFWNVSIDTQTWEVEILPLRGTAYTVDVVTFLQPPTGNPANLKIIVTDVAEYFTQGLISVDVGLRHPFPGLDEYTGCDVYGVFVTPGSVNGLYDTDVAYSNGVDDPILFDADGYTRWQNPTEFPPNGTILNFVPGNLGGQSLEVFDATINAYKYFADNLVKDQTLADFYSNNDNVLNRGMFSPGSYNEREYDLKFPLVDDFPKLIFQYAVIASWVEADMSLSGDPDILDVPGDFPLTANADEAFYIDVVDNSTLYFVDDIGGGNLSLELEVFDWGALKTGSTVQDEVFKIVVESDAIPAGFVEFDKTALDMTAAPGSTDISSVFQVDIANLTVESSNDIPVLITVENTNPDGFDPGIGILYNDDRLAGYFMYNAPVGSEIPWSIEVLDPNGGETLWMAMYHEITWDPGPGSVSDVMIEWSTDNFVSDIQLIIDSTENDGSYDWRPIPVVDTTTARIRISDVLGTDSDTSNNVFTIALPVWLDFQDEMPVNTTTVSWTGYIHSAEALSPAISQDTDGMVHVLFYNLHGSGADDAHIRSASGTSWAGQGNEAGTGGGSYPQRLDSCKVAPDQNGHSWSYGFANYWWSFVRMHSWDVDRLWGGNTGFTYGALSSTASNDRFGEYGSDSAGYLYLFADDEVDGSIYVRKTSSPNNGHSFIPVALLTNDGYVSQSRSWARQEQSLALIYTNNAGEARLAETTDAPTNVTWDTSEVIWNGTGYTDIKNTALQCDSTGRLFAAWTAQETSSGEYHVLASMRETVDGPWSDPVTVATSASVNNDVHIHSAQVDLPSGTTEEVAVVTWETGDAVFSSLSPLDLMAFLPGQDVSTTGVIVRDPDVMCIDDTSGYTYDVLFAYSWDNSGNWDIAIRQADFETP